MAIRKEQSAGQLSREELEDQDAEQLPDREQMSLINANLALPINAAIAANVLTDGRRSYEQIAEAVTQKFGRGVSEDNVRVLADSKLRPLGVLAARDGSSLKLERPNPLLALNFKTAVVPRGLVNALTTLFHPFFWPVLVTLAVAGFVALDWWLFFVHGIAQGLRHLS